MNPSHRRSARAFGDRPFAGLVNRRAPVVGIGDMDERPERGELGRSMTGT